MTTRGGRGADTDTAEGRRVMLGVAVVAGLVAAAWGELGLGLLLWAFAIGLPAAAAVWWARSAWTAVEATASLQPARVFAGEPISLRVRVANHRRLPLPIVRVTVFLPDGLDASASPEPTAFRGHRVRAWVGGRSETSLSVPVHARARGEYWVDDIQITLSDAFDLVPVRRTVSAERSLVVMPEPRGGASLPLRRRLPFGLPAPATRLYEDREHFAGVRDYRPGDPMSLVHWKVTAHTGRLQTKEYEPTRSAEVLIAVDLALGEPFWRTVDHDVAEEAIGWASHVARGALRSRFRVGLVANTHLRRGAGALRVPPTTKVGHEAALFGALARMPAQPTGDLAPVLRETARRLAPRTTVVVVSARPGPSLLHEMEVLRRRGVDVVPLTPTTGEEVAAG